MLKLSLIVFSRSLNCIYIERCLCFLFLKNFFGCLFLSIRSRSVDETKTEKLSKYQRAGLMFGGTLAGLQTPPSLEAFNTWLHTSQPN